MANTIFEGIRVIDFSNNVAGPLAGAMLSDFGADVIKVEKPVVGDDSHGITPYVEGLSLTNLWLNRGKKSIALDVKNPEGKRIFKELLKDADVLIESYKPGVMDRLGFGWEELHSEFPNLIMYSASAFGQTGSSKNLPGYDMIAQAASGLTDTTGYIDAPMRIGPSICDYACAFNGFGAISAALFYRERGGSGQHIDIALAECGLAMNDHAEIGYYTPGSHRNGNHHVLIGPYGIFNDNKGGSIVIAALNEKLWSALCELIGKPEWSSDPDLDASGKRATPENTKRIVEAVESWLCTLENVKEAETLMREQGIPCNMIVPFGQVLKQPNFIERGMSIDFPAPQLSTGSFKSRGEQIHMSETPAEIKPAPLVNQHYEEILKDVLGYTDDQIEDLKVNRAFGAQFD